MNGRSLLAGDGSWRSAATAVPSDSRNPAEFACCPACDSIIVDGAANKTSKRAFGVPCTTLCSSPGKNAGADACRSRNEQGESHGIRIDWGFKNRGQTYRRNTSDAFVPPNPNELDNTQSTDASRASLGT